MNRFYNNWEQNRRGWSDADYNNHANHSVSNNSNSYNSWSYNTDKPKKELDNFNWNYFEDTQKKSKSPSKSFNPQEFINTEFMNTNDNWRNSGKNSVKWETHEGAINTDYTFTNYSVKDEGLTEASSGMKWNDPTNRVHNNYIEHWDEQYGWVKVGAINGDLLKEGGYNAWNSPLHNTILEAELDNGDKFLIGVYDHCGQSSKESKIDLWQYNSTPNNFTGKFTVKRKGGKEFTNYNKH